MKKILLILFFISSIFAEENQLNNYLNSKDYLKSITTFDTYITSNMESTIGYNVIKIYLKNKDNKLVHFKILKEVPLIITICDFEVWKDNNIFKEKINEDCNDILSKQAQQKHILETIMSIENKIEYIYNKGGTNFRY